MTYVIRAIWNDCTDPSRPAVRVAFLYNAQDHHLFHSLPIACELSRLDVNFELVVIVRTAEQLALARTLSSVYPGHRLHFEKLYAPLGLGRVCGSLPFRKLLLLLFNKHRLNRFDALVVPERTSIFLQTLGLRHPKYIHSFHGSSGHDRIDDKRMQRFDLLLAPSAKRLQRLVEAGMVGTEHASVIGYAKIDLVSRLAATRQPIFDNGRPTVLYNPHHWTHISSWPILGWKVLDYFADSNKYNLVFAPHVRLFDPPANKYHAFTKYLGLDHIRIDLGSLASIDMTYTMTSDYYLGDVSSQVFEFLVKPRPCIFLNPRNLSWCDNPDFSSWRLGMVVSSITELDRALTTVAEWHSSYIPDQVEAQIAAFPRTSEPAPILGAKAIAEFLAASRS
jgi:hypothetical protein